MARRVTRGLPPNWIAMVAECGHADLERVATLPATFQALELFEELFPDEFDAIRDRRFAASEDGASFEALGAFVRLVGDRLFPLRDFYEFEEYGFLDEIPHVYFFDFANFDGECEGYGSAVSLGLALAWADEYGAEAFEWAGCSPDGARAIECEVLRGVAFDDLAKRARRLRGPLRHLPLAYAIAARSTGNPMLDGPCDCGGCWGLGWSLENVRLLEQSYREATEAFAKLEELALWLDVNPDARVARAVRSWNRSTRPADSVRSTGVTDVAA